MTEIPKAYEPRESEQKWYSFWSSHGYFKPGGEGPKYTITIPPPNVTGSLHIGHALCYSIHDVLVRWKRMQGFDTLCVPGMDHAGIATQNVVEKQLRKEGVSRHDLGREKFLERTWQFVNEYGGVIIGQLQKLGCSFDWDRTRFTLDEGYVDAVLECFVRWWEEDLIYKGARVINWCPRCLTAISDIEVEHEDRPAKLYHIRYPLKDGSGYVVVATTRPETMLGDTAVAANPEDERYKALFGAVLTLPLAGREIPLIADDYARPEFGSGAVKVTPSHDLNDFEAGLRHNLPQINVIDGSGRMTEAAGARYAGLDRYEARTKVVEDLQAQSLIEKIEDYTVPTALCARCGTVIEPLLSEQWFVRMKELAKPAIDAVKGGRVKFVPERYERTYLDWMENIRDWTISRQLWWGHRIPVWVTEDGDYIVARDEAEALEKAKGRPITQDEDVLDTWFSSMLWPFAVLGWPKQTEDLEKYYPTSVLITARDIIYLWVSRMIFSGIYFNQEVPFDDVYIYATVLDEQGKRMSKSLGTGIDPLEIIDLYGADALRFALLVRAARGQDIRFSYVENGRQKQVEEARNFANKIWNASRFVLMNLGEGVSKTEANWVPSDRLADRWILAELNATIDQVTRALEEYKLNEVAQTLYHFFWDDFCDWYIELSKSLVTSPEDTEEARAARGRIAYVLETSLRLLHPLMPYLTEEIWQRLPHEGESIMVASWPAPDESQNDEQAREQMQTLIALITKVRNIRSEMNIPASSRLSLHLGTQDTSARSLIDENSDQIKRLARVGEITVSDRLSARKGEARDIVYGIEISVPLEGLIDIGKERERIGKELGKKENEARGLAARLDNDSFRERAPQEVVQQARQRHDELIAEIEKLRVTLSSLGDE
ncbi:MAG TPA: valine--tRNA ligase [Blastocatellia bacterium]|nr:valine--tRNA ligase [Blastocatellia bacterium]